ncbi:unnamed protein product [Brassicogethes aeneus]|uniref:LNR domain-containing protein n=1 Tax=Brassicogethes aeneus TaxID=1431903 RepID=A0A9P0AUZ5_BRAAE|nr:unnamed protein product [Brassicogethes aeneus]
MRVRIGLKKRSIFCKIFVVCLVVYILYLFLKSLFSNNNNKDERCIHSEPIDVVYTWVNGSDTKFINDLRIYLNNTQKTNYLKKRFDDKYELKFSLRSLEKYAPWVNHVFIVTNGQIPYWLNLDYKKVTIVTHKEIFKSSYNLPTFSSPAIECNLHRIPGLSKQFIYFNDDIFLGQPMYLEDFYTPNEGFYIYLSYPLPSCSANCSWMFVGDGQCDRFCNTVNCQNDGGDCENVDMNKQYYDNFQYTGIKSTRELLEINYNKIKYNFFKNINNSTTKVKSNNTINIENSTNNYSNFTLNDNFVSYNLKKLVQKPDKGLVAKIVEMHNKKIIYRDKKRRKWNFKTKKIIDAYSESLQYTHRLFNEKYEFKTRKVPAHAPILIDRKIMENLEKKFEKDFFKTELNKIRSADDLQFSFSYYYFLINEKINKTTEEIFDVFDTDKSGTWSDREIRTLLTQIYELPLSFQIVDHFETMLLNCTEKITKNDIATPLYERYVDSRLPTISKELVSKCTEISNILKNRFGTEQKYKFKTLSQVDGDFVTFVMLHSNISEVVSHLDEIRSRPKKFICLNDDLDYIQNGENEFVKSILYDFYLSLFPIPSQFELPDEYRNKFLYTDDLNMWKNHHFNVNVLIVCAILILIYFTFLKTIKKVCCRYVNKLFC